MLILTEREQNNVHTDIIEEKFALLWDATQNGGVEMSSKQQFFTAFLTLSNQIFSYLKSDNSWGKEGTYLVVL